MKRSPVMLPSINRARLKKRILTGIPYALIALFGTKIGQGWRMAPGADFPQKMLHIVEGLKDAFESIAPSFHPFDIAVGCIISLVIAIAVYMRGKNAKKFRKNEEYGSARWGTPADIAPFIDPVFSNNIILTETERLMMSNRPKNPKYARNKNVLVVGGSGSGKTRFFVKANILQSNSSLVVTDPKTTVCAIINLVIHDYVQSRLFYFYLKGG